MVASRRGLESASNNTVVSLIADTHAGSPPQRAFIPLVTTFLVWCRCARQLCLWVVRCPQEELTCKSSKVSRSCSLPDLDHRPRSNRGRSFMARLSISHSRRRQGGYVHTEALQGVRSFALWPLDRQHSPALARIPGRRTRRFPKPGSNLMSRRCTAQLRNWSREAIERSSGTRRSHGVRRSHDFFPRKGCWWSDNHSIDAAVMSAFLPLA